MRIRPVGSFPLILLLVGFLMGSPGCALWDSLFKSEIKKELEKTPESLVQEGLDFYQRKKFAQAIEAFQKLKDRYPYNQYAILAELKLADSYFLNKDYELAAAAYKEFEKMHPANEVIAYIVFQVGMSYFKQMPTIDRDQSNAEKAAQEFDRLIKTYPQSEYLAEARKNLILSQKNMALHEFYIGEFYFKANNCQAALGRFEAALKKYPDVPPTPTVKSQIEACQKKAAAAK